MSRWTLSISCDPTGGALCECTLDRRAPAHRSALAVPSAKPGRPAPFRVDFALDASVGCATTPAGPPSRLSVHRRAARGTRGRGGAARAGPAAPTTRSLTFSRELTLGCHSGRCFRFAYPFAIVLSFHALAWRNGQMINTDSQTVGSRLAVVQSG